MANLRFMRYRNLYNIPVSIEGQYPPSVGGTLNVTINSSTDINAFSQRDSDNGMLLMTGVSNMLCSVSRIVGPGKVQLRCNGYQPN